MSQLSLEVANYTSAQKEYFFSDGRSFSISRHACMGSGGNKVFFVREIAPNRFSQR